ncbi:MAG: NAD(P)-dependent oxidoreductase [Hyphomicrobiales bacterium]
MPTVYSTHPLHPDAVALLGSAATLKVATALDAGALAREGHACDIVIVRAPLPEEIFGEGTKLKAAIRHGAGVDMIPVEAATKAGVLVANVPGVNASSVAEHVVFSAIALLHRFRLLDRDLRAKGWLEAREYSLSNHDLAGRAIGIVGMGAVGKAITSAFGGLGVKLLGFSPSGRNFPGQVASLPLDDVIAASDILVLCCPLKPETRGLIDARRFSLLKRGSILINVSRGPVVDEAALIEALRTGHLWGAALDVFNTQPLPRDHAFFSFDNVIITPHMAGITEESMARMGTGAIAEALRVLRGELPVNLINPDVVEAYRRRFG